MDAQQSGELGDGVGQKRGAVARGRLGKVVVFAVLETESESSSLLSIPATLSPHTIAGTLAACLFSSRHLVKAVKWSTSG